MQLATMHNGEISICSPLLQASSNNVIIMFDFEPFNSVITTHYFSVLFDLRSLKPENSVFSMPLIVSCVQNCVCLCVRVCPISY